MKKILFAAFTLCCAAFLSVSCSNDEGDKGEKKTLEITDLVVDESVSLKIGEEKSITAEFEISGNVELTNYITFESNNSDIATAVQDGNTVTIKGIDKGETTIEIKNSFTKESIASIPVTVEYVTMEYTVADADGNLLTDESDAIQIWAGETYTITSTLKVSDVEVTDDITPYVKFVSIPDGAATFETTGLETTITAVEAGEATIYARRVDSNSSLEFFDIFVQQAPTVIKVEPITLDAKSAVSLDDYISFTPAGALEDVTVTFNPEGVATYDAESGEITGVKGGTTTATITSEYGSTPATTTATITVNAVTISIIKVAYPGYLMAGSKYTMRSTITPAGYTNADITWKSNDTAIATIDANGVVTAVAEGVTTITYTAKDNVAATGEVNIGVTPTGYMSVSFSDIDADLYSSLGFGTYNNKKATQEYKHTAGDAFGMMTISDKSGQVNVTYKNAKINNKEYPFMAIKANAPANNLGNGFVFDFYDASGGVVNVNTTLNDYKNTTITKLSAGTEGVVTSGNCTYPYYNGSASENAIIVYCFQHDQFTNSGKNDLIFGEEYTDAAFNYKTYIDQGDRFEYEVYYYRLFKTEAEMIKFIEEEDAYWAAQE